MMLVTTVARSPATCRRNVSNHEPLWSRFPTPVAMAELAERPIMLADQDPLLPRAHAVTPQLVNELQFVALATNLQ